MSEHLSNVIFSLSPYLLNVNINGKIKSNAVYLVHRFCTANGPITLVGLLYSHKQHFYLFKLYLWPMRRMPPTTNIITLKKRQIYTYLLVVILVSFIILSFKSLKTSKDNRVSRNVNKRELEYGRAVHHVPRFHSFPLTGNLQTVEILTPSSTLSLPVAFWSSFFRSI